MQNISSNSQNIIKRIPKFDKFLCSILLVGLIVRLWGINFGLPHTESRPDETLIVAPALGFLSGDIHPHSFDYPSLYKYIISGVYLLYFLIGKILGRYTSVSDLMTEFAADPSNYYLMARCVSALLGTATIFIVYKISKKLFNRQTALVSSLFLSLTYLHVRDSHFGVTDVPMIFFIMLSFLFILRSYEHKNIKNYIIAGLIAGFATSTKYNGLLLVIPMAVVHGFSIIDEQKENLAQTDSSRPWLNKFLPYFVGAIGIIFILVSLFSTPEFAQRYLSSDGKIEGLEVSLQLIRSTLLSVGLAFTSLVLIIFTVKPLSNFLDLRILLFTVTLIFGFFAGTPFSIPDFRQFGLYFLGQMIHLKFGHVGVKSLGIGWWFHVKNTFPLGLGLPLFLSSLAGIPILIKKSPRKAAILLSLPLIYYLTLGRGYAVFLRYMLPMFPFFCIVAAVFVISFSHQVKQYLQPPFSKQLVILFLTTLIILPSTYHIVQSNHLLAKQDNRLIAKEWVKNNLEANTSIYQQISGYAKVQLYPSQESLEELKQEKLVRGEFGPAQLVQAQIDYLQQNKITVYEQWDYDEKSNNFLFNKQPQNTKPDYIIQYEHPLIQTGFYPQDEFPKAVQNLLESQYVLKKSFEVISLKTQDNWFDKIDAFYLPFTGFKNIERPGPNIYIYQKNSL